MKNANKAETSREAKALSVVAKVEKQSRAKGKPAAATVEQVNGLSTNRRDQPGPAGPAGQPGQPPSRPAGASRGPAGTASGASRDSLRDSEFFAERIRLVGALHQYIPRIARIVAVDVPQYVPQQGNHRASIFFSDQDRYLYNPVPPGWERPIEKRRKREVTVVMRRKPVDSKPDQPSPIQQQNGLAQRVHGASARFGGATPRRPRPHRAESRRMPAAFPPARSGPHAAKCYRNAPPSRTPSQKP